MKEIAVIVYTTQYRKGGRQFEKVAQTMTREKTDSGLEVLCRAIESKADMKRLFREIAESAQSIREFHFIGHAGMYGPMYGTANYPEQFSPYELRKLQIPFAEQAEAYFHCCRSARWFAPYFASVQQVKTGGYHWYTAFSTRKDKFQLPIGEPDDLYCFGCPGKKSHGLLASVKKYLGLMKPEEMKFFSPVTDEVDNTYDSVAAQYAETFKDIKVRKDEFRWLMKHLPQDSHLKVLDVGCGNGALLKELSPHIAEGMGVDVSGNLLAQARVRHAALTNISFQQIEGPALPFDDDTFDVVVSLLSFRYLDWDPIMLEIERVLKPNGKLLIIDMVTAPVTLTEWPAFFRGKLSHYFDKFRHPEFYRNLHKLVSHPDWHIMLKYNPIRSQREMKTYLESRFPGRKAQVINVGMHSRIMAFDSQHMRDTQNRALTYP